VINTREEIVQAFEDFQAGRVGTIPAEKLESWSTPAHQPTRGPVRRWPGPRSTSSSWGAESSVRPLGSGPRASSPPTPVRHDSKFPRRVGGDLGNSRIGCGRGLACASVFEQIEQRFDERARPGGDMVATMATRGLDRPARCDGRRGRAPRRTGSDANLRPQLCRLIESESVDPVRNPYAPGAGQRPPELAGRDRELKQFEVVIERVARGRPERSMIVTGLRGVGKTVLLNAFRSMAIQRQWGTGKIEARPEQSIRRPVASALHRAVRELAPRHRAPDRIEEFLGVLKAFAQSGPEPSGREKARAHRWQPGIDVPATRGRADSGDLEIDLTELFVDAASVATDVGVGIALFVDEMQDIPADDVSALCAACHELSQVGGPLIVVGAGLPHLPAVLSASKSYSERLFRYARIDRLDRESADRALLAPAEREEVTFTKEALDALYGAADGYPYFVQA